jgi:hypothetical protein
LLSRTGKVQQSSVVPVNPIIVAVASKRQVQLIHRVMHLDAHPCFGFLFLSLELLLVGQHEYDVFAALPDFVRLKRKTKKQNVLSFCPMQILDI